MICKKYILQIRYSRLGSLKIWGQVDHKMSSESMEKFFQPGESMRNKHLYSYNYPEAQLEEEFKIKTK